MIFSCYQVKSCQKSRRCEMKSAGA